MKEDIDWEELLFELDLEDEKFIIVDYDNEKIEPKFRWEYAHESVTESDSVFRRIKNY
jgi:hypothetical protein